MNIHLFVISHKDVTIDFSLDKSKFILIYTNLLHSFLIATRPLHCISLSIFFGWYIRTTTSNKECQKTTTSNSKRTTTSIREQKITTSNRRQKTINTGKKSCLSCSVTMRRQLLYFVPVLLLRCSSSRYTNRL